MKFKPVFRLTIQHSYYADGICREFSVVASRETQRLLRNHRALMRVLPDGVLCSIETGTDGSPLIGVEASAKLSFDLILRNDEFCMITDLDEITAKTPALFSLAEADVSKGGTLNLASSAKGLGRGVFAVAEIPGAAFANPGSEPINFSIGFQAKRSRWLYYYVTDTKLIGKDIRLVDLDSPAELVFSPANRTDLAQNPDPNDSLGAELARRYPSLNRMRFVSDEVLPCQESPRRLTLQLDGHNFPNLLPLPSPRNQTNWPFTNQKNVAGQSALYQVVKYNSYSFSTNGV